MLDRVHLGVELVDHARPEHDLRPLDVDRAPVDGAQRRGVPEVSRDERPLDVVRRGLAHDVDAVV